MIKIVCFILIILLLTLTVIKNDFEYYNDLDTQLFNNMMSHYDKIFPNNANRNAAGFRFFEYIYDNFALTEDLFDRYNKYYCAVSGSIVSPERKHNFSILKVKDLNNQCVFGKYYRCCTPCNCDIMKYTKVINTQIELPKNSGNFIQRNLLTIGDPCVSEDSFPEEIDSSIFRCNNKLLNFGYRVNDENKLTRENGRLVIGVLYPIENKEESLIDNSVNMCLTGSKRILTPPENLVGGMGDIFVNIALLNNNDVYTNTVNDLCN